MDSPSPPTFRRFVTLRNGLGVLAVFCVALALARSDLFLSQADRFQQATTLFDTGRILEAQEILRPLVKSSRAPSNVRRLEADILLARGELKEARDRLLAMLPPKSTNPDIALQLGFTELFLGKLDSASMFAGATLHTAGDANDTLLQARALYVLGCIAFNRAQYDSALLLQQQSLQLARLIRSTKAEANALRQLGVLCWYRGKADSALSAFYEPALDLYRRIHDRSGEATTLSNIGLIHQQRNEWEKNLQYQLQAYDTRKRIGDQVGLCDSYYTLTHIPLPPKEARALFLTYIRRSLELSTRIGYAWGREVASRQLEGMYRTYLQLDSPPEAGRDSADGILSGEGTLFALQRKAWNLIAKENPLEAEPYLRRVVQVSDSLQYTSLLTTALTEHGAILAHLGKTGEARTNLLRALALAEAGEQHHLPWIKGKLAELHTLEGDYRGAKRILNTTIRGIDSLYRAKLAGSAPDIGFLTALSSIHRNRTELYEQVIGLLSAHNDGELFSLMERERLLPFWGGNTADSETTPSPFHRTSREFIRLLEQYESDPSGDDPLQPLIAFIGELRSTSLGEQALVSRATDHAIETSPAALPLLSSRLQPHEAFIEFYVTRTQTLLLVIRSGRSDLVTVPLREENLVQLVSIHRETILRGGRSEADSLWKGPARRLFQLLLEPLVRRGLIRPGDHLILSPHRSLHLVSFPSLLISQKSEPPKFLVEQYDLSLAPSATMWVRVRAPSKVTSLLTILPEPTSLPHAERETEGVSQQLVRNQRILRGSDATAGAILTAMRDYDIVHIATHASMNWRFPLYSTIQCHDRGVELHEILNLSLKAGLVVLSACESGLSVGAVGSIPAGHDLVSLPRAFLSAGAARVVVSLWRVEDESTGLLMQEFYQNLIVPQDAPPDKPLFSLALNQAQRARIEAGRRDGKNHPFFWAAFYHTGVR